MKRHGEDPLNGEQTLGKSEVLLTEEEWGVTAITLDLTPAPHYLSQPRFPTWTMILKIPRYYQTLWQRDADRQEASFTDFSRS